MISLYKNSKIKLLISYGTHANFFYLSIIHNKHMRWSLHSPFSFQFSWPQYCPNPKMSSLPCLKETGTIVFSVYTLASCSTKWWMYKFTWFINYANNDIPTSYNVYIPLSEENVSVRKMCLREHIFLGKPVLPDRIYCPPQDQVFPCNSYVSYHVILFNTTMEFYFVLQQLHVDDTIYDHTNGAPSQHSDCLPSWI